MHSMGIELQDDLYRKLKVRCAIEGTTMISVIRRLIEGYLAEAETKPEETQTSGAGQPGGQTPD